MQDISGLLGNESADAVFANAMQDIRQCRDPDARLELLGEWLHALKSYENDIIVLEDVFGVLDVFHKRVTLVRMAVETNATTSEGMRAKVEIMRWFVWRDVENLSRKAMKALVNSITDDHWRIREEAGSLQGMIKEVSEDGLVSYTRECGNPPNR